VADDGAQQFAILANHLRAAGSGDLRRQLYDAISTAVRPALAQVRAGIPAHVPSGYAPELEADLKLDTRKYTGPDPGIRIAATAPTPWGGHRKLARIEDGLLNHPLFGDRKRWYGQTDGMVPKFFSGPLEAAAPAIRDAILAAMHDIAVQITRRA